MIRNERKSELVEIIKKNPGVKFREIMRFSGMKNGVLSHHLTKLEQDGIVQVKREPRQTRFFPLHISDNESKIIKALRRQTPKDIIEALILNEKLAFKAIVKEANKSPSTVSLYLSQLVKDGIVIIQTINRKKMYMLADKQTIDKLIDEYHPRLIEKPTSGFEDIFNSL
jgi:predicted transcriptional regulator